MRNNFFIEDNLTPEPAVYDKYESLHQQHSRTSNGQQKLALSNEIAQAKECSSTPEDDI
jgi:hypothetical protein